MRHFTQIIPALFIISSMMMMAFTNPLNKRDEQLEKVVLYYCIENPSFHASPEEAMEYLELRGMRDKELQQKINDSLKAWTGHTRVLHKFKGAELGRTFNRPFGKKYSAYSGCRYGWSTVKFRRFEKVRRFTSKQIAEAKGNFAPVCHFGWQIVRGHFLVYNSSYWVDLRNGKRIYPEMGLPILPERRDTFNSFFGKAQVAIIPPLRRNEFEVYQWGDTLTLDVQSLNEYVMRDSCEVHFNFGWKLVANPEKEQRVRMSIPLQRLHYFTWPDYRDKIELYFSSIEP